MDENELYEWRLRHVEIDENSGEEIAIVLQECDECGKQFRVAYHPNSTYEYVNRPCNCESTFHPIDGPSISEWVEGLYR